MMHPNSSTVLRQRQVVPRRFLRRDGLCALAVFLVTTHAGLAAQQQQPETFSLPSSTPSPTQTSAPAPQGPADEIVGVPIGPRVIPEVRENTPAPTPAVARPTASPSTSPALNPPVRSGSTQSPSAVATEARRQPSQDRPTTTSASSVPSVQNAEARGAGIGGDEPVSPGFDSLGEEQDILAPRGPDGWYTIDEAGSQNQGVAKPQNPSVEQPNTSSVWDRFTEQSGITAALLALMALLAGILIWVVRQRKKAEAAIADAPATVLTAGIRASMGEEADSQIKNEAQPQTARRTQGPQSTGADKHNQDDRAPTEPEPAHPASSATPSVSTPKPEPEPEPSTAAAPLEQPNKMPTTPPTARVRTAPDTPLSIELSLDINSASRSLMRLSVEFTLEVANRTNSSIRALNIAGELACVQEGAIRPAPVDKTMHLTTIDRITSQQSRRIKGTLKLPVSDITAIKQNGKPVVIPLIHFRLGTADQPAIKRTFVVGTPSISNLTRVHPLVFDGPPGSLPPLRAQLIKQA